MRAAGTMTLEMPKIKARPSVIWVPMVPARLRNESSERIPAAPARMAKSSCLAWSESGGTIGSCGGFFLEAFLRDIHWRVTGN